MYYRPTLKQLNRIFKRCKSQSSSAGIEPRILRLPVSYINLYTTKTPAIQRLKVLLTPQLNSLEPRTGQGQGGGPGWLYSPDGSSLPRRRESNHASLHCRSHILTVILRRLLLYNV